MNIPSKTFDPYFFPGLEFLRGGFKVIFIPTEKFETWLSETLDSKLILPQIKKEEIFRQKSRIDRLFSKGQIEEIENLYDFRRFSPDQSVVGGFSSIFFNTIQFLEHNRFLRFKTQGLSYKGIELLYHWVRLLSQFFSDNCFLIMEEAFFKNAKSRDFFVFEKDNINWRDILLWRKDWITEINDLSF